MMNTVIWKKYFWLSCLLVLATPSTAFFYAELKIPSEILIDRSIQVKNRFELAVFFFDTSVRNIFVKHNYAAHLAAGYHFFEWLELELTGGYVFLSDESNLIKNIRYDFPADQMLSLPSLWQTHWYGGANVLWAPFYGKLSLFSEIQSYFQIYFLLGGALESISRFLEKKEQMFENNFRFGLNAGGGIRVFLTDRIAFRGEVKEAIGFNPKLNGKENDISYGTWIMFGISFFI